MIKLGDIVKPKPFCMGSNYLFRVSAITRTMGSENKYKLERIEQVLNPIYGSVNEQLRVISKLENCIWRENELELAGPTPDYPQEIKNKKMFDIGADIAKYSLQSITKKEPIYQEKATPYVPFDVKYYKDVNFDSLKANELLKFLNNKEEKEMDILKLYEGRKGEEIANNYLKERERILKEDEIQSIIIEMKNQVNTILENQNLRDRLKVDVEGLHTAETEKKLEELKKSTDAEREKLRSTLEEIRALFEMTDDYENRCNILKKYGILGDDGRLNV